MTEIAPLRLVDEEDEPIEPTGPTVFTRSISTPPGAPWDQARAAGLEARLGAPLPLGEVTYRLWRLDRWGFGRPARYAVCYVRSREVGDRFDTTVVVDGRPFRIQLFSNAEQRRRAQTSLMVLAGMIVVVLLIAAALVSAWSTRSQATLKLAAVQQAAAVRLHQAESLERLKDQTRGLNAAHVRGQSLNDFLNDLAWASAAKAPGAHIDTLHWERGLMGIEVRGDAPPFGQSDRAVIKVDKPVRPGVWLWGVGAAGRTPPAVPVQSRAASGPQP
jgi:hypothetical protein